MDSPRKHINFFIIVLYAVVGYYATVVFVPSFIKCFLPFILAFAVASAARPLALFMHVKWRIPQKLCAVLSVAVFFLTVGALAAYITTSIFMELFEISVNKSEVIIFIEKIISEFNSFTDSFRSDLSPEFELFFDSVFKSIADNALASVSSVCQYIFVKITNIALLLPDAFIFIIVFLVSCVFFSVDYDFIRKRLGAVLPAGLLSRASEIKLHVTAVLLKYFRGMFYIFVIVYIVALVGFTLLGVEYAFLLALLAAVLDILPVVGSGAFLIPYSVIMFVSGNVSSGVGFFALYLCITVTRQVSEPKIIGKSLGLHPLVTLISAYAGYKILGAFGIIALPVLVIILICLFKEGIINFQTAVGESDSE